MRALAGLGLLALVATSHGAAAQGAAPASPCAKMKDATGCVCALATGGMVSATSWARGQDRYAFEACLSAHGAIPASGRPTTISARR